MDLNISINWGNTKKCNSDELNELIEHSITTIGILYPDGSTEGSLKHTIEEKEFNGYFIIDIDTD